MSETKGSQLIEKYSVDRFERLQEGTHIHLEIKVAKQSSVDEYDVCYRECKYFKFCCENGYNRSSDCALCIDMGRRHRCKECQYTYYSYKKVNLIIELKNIPSIKKPGRSLLIIRCDEPEMGRVGSSHEILGVLPGDSLGTMILQFKDGQILSAYVKSIMGQT